MLPGVEQPPRLVVSIKSPLSERSSAAGTAPLSHSTKTQGQEEYLAHPPRRHHSCGTARESHPFPPGDRSRPKPVRGHGIYRIRQQKDRGNRTPGHHCLTPLFIEYAWTFCEQDAVLAFSPQQNTAVLFHSSRIKKKQNRVGLRKARPGLLTGKKSNVRAYLGNAGAGDALFEHIRVVTNGMPPGIELLQRGAVLIADVFNTHPAA